MTDSNRTLRRCAASVAALAALTGCASGGNTTPDPAPASTAPAPLPTQDWNRLACHTLPGGMLENLTNLADTRRAAEHAIKSTNPIVAQHGRDLRDAVTARETADLNGQPNSAVNANLNISQAALDLAEACATLYGDGPW